MKKSKVIKGAVQQTLRVESRADRVVYQHVTFDHEDGNIEQVKCVVVPSVVDAYFQVGTEGEFFFYKHGKTHTLLGFKTAGRKIYSEDDLKTIWRKSFRAHVICLAFTAFFAFLLFVAIHDKAPDGLIFSFGSLVAMAYFSFKTRVGGAYMRPSKAKEFLAAQGF